MNMKKALKLLDDGTIEVLQGMDNNELRDLIVQAEQSILDTKEELEKNPKYQELKENLKALRSGFTEVKNRQQAKILFSLVRLGEIGVPVNDEQDVS